MFWKKKKKQKGKVSAKQQAEAIAAQKRDEIGDETLEKIRQAIIKRENSPMAQAKRKIADMDQDKILDNISWWMSDKR